MAQKPRALMPALTFAGFVKLITIELLRDKNTFIKMLNRWSEAKHLPSIERKNTLPVHHTMPGLPKPNVIDSNQAFATMESNAGKAPLEIDYCAPEAERNAARNAIAAEYQAHYGAED